MKVQMRNILVWAAVGDETVAFSSRLNSLIRFLAVVKRSAIKSVSSGDKSLRFDNGRLEQSICEPDM